MKGWILGNILKLDGVSCKEAAVQLHSDGCTWLDVMDKAKNNIEKSQDIIAKAKVDVFDDATVAHAVPKEQVIEHNKQSIKWNIGVFNYAVDEHNDIRSKLVFEGDLDDDVLRNKLKLFPHCDHW